MLWNENFHVYSAKLCHGMNLKNINNKKIVLLFQVHIFAYFWKQDGEIMASYDLHICYTI